MFAAVPLLALPVLAYNIVALAVCPADPTRVRRPIVFDDTLAGDDLDVPDFLK